MELEEGKLSSHLNDFPGFRFCNNKIKQCTNYHLIYAFHKVYQNYNSEIHRCVCIQYLKFSVFPIIFHILELSHFIINENTLENIV